MTKDLTKYVDKAMFAAEPVSDEATKVPQVYLLSATPDPLGSVAAMAKMYEGKVVRNLADVTDEERVHYWGEVQKTHLKAPLEAIDLHFMVEGVTRAFTHQMVRQRTAVYAQESMRFAVKDSIAARPGPLVAADPDAMSIWDDAIDRIWEAYNVLIASGIPAEEARGLLPHDTLTRLNFKTNLRNLADHLGNRLCTQAQWEWRLVAAAMRKAIGTYRAPIVRPDESKVGYEGYEPTTRLAVTDWQFRAIAESDMFRPVCYAMGRCPFQAGFDRGCTIRGRVEAGEFDKIDPREWMADPTAGWVR